MFPMFLAGSILVKAVQMAFDENPTDVSYDSVKAKLDSATLASVNPAALEDGTTRAEVVTENESFQVAIPVLDQLLDAAREHSLNKQIPFLFGLGNSIASIQMQAALSEVMGEDFEPLMNQVQRMTGASTKHLDI